MIFVGQIPDARYALSNMGLLRGRNIRNSWSIHSISKYGGITRVASILAVIGSIACLTGQLGDGHTLQSFVDSRKCCVLTQISSEKNMT